MTSEKRERDVGKTPVLSSVVMRVSFVEEVEGGMIERTRAKILEEAKMEKIEVIIGMITREDVTGENMFPGKGILKREGGIHT